MQSNALLIPPPCVVKSWGTELRLYEELTMRSIASATTDHGISTIKIDDLLHRMLSGVRVLESPTVEQVRISDMKQTITKTSEETNMFTPTTFQSSQRHSTVDYPR